MFALSTSPLRRLSWVLALVLTTAFLGFTNGSAGATAGTATGRAEVTGPSCGGGSHSVPNPITGAATTYWAMGERVEGSGFTTRTFSYWLVEELPSGGSYFRYSRSELVICGILGRPSHVDLVAVPSTGLNPCTQTGDHGAVEDGVAKYYELVGERVSRIGPGIVNTARFRFWHVRKAAPGWQFDRALLASCSTLVLG